METNEIISSQSADESETMAVSEDESSSSILNMEIDDEIENACGETNESETTQDGSSNKYAFVYPMNLENFDCVMQPEIEYSPSAPLSQHLRTSCPPERLAYNWIQKYKLNKQSAIKSLLEVVLRSTGICNPPLTQFRHITPQNVKELTVDQFDNWMKQSSCEPYVHNEDYQQKIHIFIGNIVGNLLPDVQLMEMLQGVLHVMHNSHYMSARLSAIIFETSILDAFSNCLGRIKSNMVSVKGRALKRLERQHKKIKDYILENSKIILHSLRDVKLPVRTCAFRIFKLLIYYFPGVFVHDVYLRAIFWQLFDSSPTMRILAIEFCSTLLTNSRYNINLDVFSRKCIPELSKLTRDESTKVSTEAVKALNLIRRFSPEMISNTILESIFLLVFCNHPTVASEAAWVVYESFKKTSNGDTVTFLSGIIKFVHDSEVSLNCTCNIVFLKFMLPKAGVYLTSWSAWITILTGDVYQDTPDLAVNACQLFASVVRNTATGNLTAKVFLSIDERFDPENETHDDNRENPSAAQEQMTNVVQSSIIELWQKYGKNRECLLPLLTLPQYFCYNSTIDYEKLILKIFSIIPSDDTVLEEVMITLACIQKMIQNSPKWKDLAAKFEVCVLKIAENYLKFFRELVADPNQMDSMKKLPGVLKITMYTLKYFDLSQTAMKDGLFQALSLHVANNLQLVKLYIPPMCLYMIEWQLKDIPSLVASDDRVAKLEQQVNVLFIALDKFLHDTNSDTRTMAFTVLCRLLELFCRTSEFIKDLPPSIQIQPTILMSEWLNFNLNVLVPTDVTYTDSQQFEVAAKHLKRFCNLISSGVLHFSYLSSVLPHFSLYSKDGNYNAILRKLIEDLSLNAKLPSMIVYTLVFTNIVKGQAPCQMITEGLAHVVFSKLKKEDALKTLNWDILYAASHYIQKTKEYSLLQPLTSLVQFMTKDEVLTVKPPIVDVFSREEGIFNTEVEQFLNSFPEHN